MEAAIPVGGERRVGHKRVRAEIVDPIEILERPGETEEHEAAHAVVTRKRGTEVDEISNIAGPGYLGYMKGGFDALGVAAPHALGLPGGGSPEEPGSDLWQLDQQGYHIPSVLVAARAFAQDKRQHIKALATRLRRDRVVRRHTIDKVIDRIDRGPTIRITTEDPKGNTTTKDVRGVDGHTNIFVPVE